MLSTDQAQHLRGKDSQVVGNDGDRIGNISQNFLDDKTGEPAWVTVNTDTKGRT